jgi:hypothetical protein
MLSLLDGGNPNIQTEDEQKWREIESFLTEHGIKLHRKKIRDLVSFSEGGLAVYKGNIIVSSCCRVRVPHLLNRTIRSAQSYVHLSLLFMIIEDGY